MPKITIMDTNGTEVEMAVPNVVKFANEIIGYVTPIFLTVPFGKVMLVDEDGLSKNLPLNQKASIKALQRIVGKVIICNQDALN